MMKNNSKLNDLLHRIFRDVLLSPSKYQQRGRTATSQYYFTACHFGTQKLITKLSTTDQ